MGSARAVRTTCLNISAITALAVLAPESKALYAVFNLGERVQLLGWYFSNGNKQDPYVIENYGKHYPREGWSKPLLFGCVLLVGVILAAGFVAIGLAAAGILS